MKQIETFLSDLNKKLHARNRKNLLIQSYESIEIISSKAENKIQ